MDVLGYVLTAAGAYLMGSLPTGYLVAQAKGVDLRTVGSGNIGATNAFRVLGPAAGLVVLAVDGLKGFAACFWLSALVAQWLQMPPGAINTLRIVAAMGAVLGHNFSCWLNFRGGKGVATSAGAYFALAPVAAAIALAAWILILALSRYVSLASIVAAVVLPTAVWLTQGFTLGLITTVLGLMAIWRHRSNIVRLLNGTERRLGCREPVKEPLK